MLDFISLLNATNLEQSVENIKDSSIGDFLSTTGLITVFGGGLIAVLKFIFDYIIKTFNRVDVLETQRVQQLQADLDSEILKTKELQKAQKEQEKLLNDEIIKSHTQALELVRVLYEKEHFKQKVVELKEKNDQLEKEIDGLKNEILNLKNRIKEKNDVIMNLSKEKSN